MATGPNHRSAWWVTPAAGLLALAVQGADPAIAKTTAQYPPGLWARPDAIRAARAVDHSPTLRQLESLLSSGDTESLLTGLENLAGRADWPEPARDAAIMSFVRVLQNRPPDEVPGAVRAWLRNYAPQAWVPHVDHPRNSVPLFSIPAAAAGLEHLALREDARRRGQALLAEQPSELAAAWRATAETPARRGLLDALATASPSQARQALETTIREWPDDPDMAALVGTAARVAGDSDAFVHALQMGDGVAANQLLRQAANTLDPALAAQLLQPLLAGEDPPLTALAIAHLGPVARQDKYIRRQLLDLVASPALGSTAALALVPRAATGRPLRSLPTPLTQAAQDGILAEWVEHNPSSAGNRIALGYPVPIPVDTSLPFDGFRSQAGLQARHQDLAASTPWVHPHTIGTTHKGRTIWAYRLGDADRTTPWGLPEPATLTNGGIHAREWSTPETVTGILELIATAPADAHIYDFLREQVNMIVIPVLNIDGFVQTQRDPTLNYLGSDPDFPDSSPRDGRMRRKNLLNTDENLSTREDHLGGVDLNRNNGPYWARNAQRSSGDPASLVHHGTSPASEPEIQALQAAPDLGPGERLRIYTDVHSYSQVHFWSRLGDGAQLARQTQDVLRVFSNHHQAFGAGKRYHYAYSANVPVNQGIGSTEEYFLYTYRVPSWTLETEPTGGQSYHAASPGGGADYGGAGVNVHDGFILPESQVRRVREELAQTFATVFYRQAGPPNLQAIRVLDAATDAVLLETQWDGVDEATRSRFSQQLRSLAPGQDYRLWLGFSKPMRWVDEQGHPVALQGHNSAAYLDVDVELRADAETELDVAWGDVEWLVEPGGAPDGYLRYRTDALAIPFTIAESTHNQSLLASPLDVTLRVRAWDMTLLGLDGDPSSVADWADGQWSGFEDSSDNDTGIGGWDDTQVIRVEAGPATEPFLLPAGIASAWFDPAHDGEGFIIEMLTGGRAVLYWYTYDDSGHQDWYIGGGEVRGNRLVFPELTRTSGGTFGDAFDPEQVTREVVGTAKFLFSDCDNGEMDWHIGNRQGRQSVQRITHVAGLDCGLPRGEPVRQEAQFSGAWYDPSHDGEGFTLQVLSGDDVVVYWFSFDPEGARRWFFGLGKILDGRFVFEDLLTSSGGIFGPGFDPATVSFSRWGRLEIEPGCGGGTAHWTSVMPGFDDGSLELVQLTHPDGLGCAATH